jgi:phosphatidylinositol alpha-mannosyltransferase
MIYFELSIENHAKIVSKRGSYNSIFDAFHHMKIAQVCPYDFSRPGGVKSHIVSLAKYLTKIGHEVKIIAPNINSENVEESNVHFFGKNRSLNIGGTKIDLNIALGEEKKALKEFLQAENFDIIHYHTIWNPLLPFQIRRYGKAKHVATFHDTPKNLFIGKWIMPLAARWVFSFVDEIISVSKTQSSFIKRFSNREIQIIPNGIDLEEIQSQPKVKKDPSVFQVLFLGRLEPRKGVMHALEAYRKFKMTYQNCKLVIAGDGDERKLVEDYIAKYDLRDVELKGFVDEATKYALLKESDIYLAPALYGESFGIVLLEAMSIGTPMAGYANEGYKNVLTPDMLQYFSDPADLDGLVKNIEGLLLSEKRERMTIKGFEEVKKYDWNTLASQVELLYGAS